jgi:hypothetical protein
MADDTKTAYRGLARVAFLARREDFQRLLDAGYPLRVIYEEHKAHLAMGYPQFTRYVGRYLQKARYARQPTNAGRAPPAPAESGRVAFLARREDFQRRLDAGYALRVIYEEHKHALGIGYPQFTRYVSRYLRKAGADRHPTEDGQAAPATAPTAVERAPTPPPEPPAKPAVIPTGRVSDVFVYDPTDAYTRDDLI